MNKLHIFTDVSLNATLAIGFGACLIIQEEQLQLDQPESNINLKKFKTTSSTKLEIECLLWALKEVMKQNKDDKLIIYTDSQCIAGLLDRREKLEQKDFKSGKTKEALINAELYKQFYSLSDQLNFEVIKLKGHTKKKEKDILHQLFSQVDQAARKELKKHK